MQQLHLLRASLRVRMRRRGGLAWTASNSRMGARHPRTLGAPRRDKTTSGPACHPPTQHLEHANKVTPGACRCHSPQALSCAAGTLHCEPPPTHVSRCGARHTLSATCWHATPFAANWNVSRLCAQSFSKPATVADPSPQLHSLDPSTPIEPCGTARPCTLASRTPRAPLAPWRLTTAARITQIHPFI